MRQGLWFNIAATPRNILCRKTAKGASRVGKIPSNFSKGKEPAFFIAWHSLFMVTICLQVLYMIGEGFSQMLSGAMSLLFFPVIGWLADVKFGRYPITKVTLSFFSKTTFCYLPIILWQDTWQHTLFDIIFFAGSFTLYLALSCYTSFFLQIVTEQQLQDSLGELFFTIYWLYLGIVLSEMVEFCINCVVSEITTVICLHDSYHLGWWW